jgi:CRISPR-associated protein Cas2
MTVMVLERVSASLRGELTRWLLEPHTGVFVGRPSALVRDKLWELICDKLKSGAALMIYSSDAEQGFTMRTCGKTARQLRDFEGLALVMV